MNILLSSHYFYPHIGGIESVVDDHARRLSNRGHDVTVVTSTVGTNQQRTQRAGYEIRRFTAWNPLERFGVPYPVPDPVDVRRTLETLFDDIAVDVVHAHGMNYLTTAAVMRSVPAEIPTFLHQHTPFVEYSRPVNVIERVNDTLVGRYTLGEADRVYCVSENIEQYVQRVSRGVETEVMTNGIDTTFYHPERERGDGVFDCDPATPVFFILSRLCRKKGLDVVLDAARALEERSVDAHIAIAGDGPMREDVNRAAAELSTVEAMGHLEEDALAECYATADSVLFTSKSGEAFPTLTMLEAYASGTPVIATRLAALPEGLEDNVNTLLIEPEDVSGLIDAIVELAADEKRRARMGREAREAATRYFSIESRIDRLESAYESAIAGRDGDKKRFQPVDA